MKQLSFIIIFLTTLSSHCQKHYLQPVKDFCKEGADLKKYYEKIFPLLYEGLQKKPYARYTVLSRISKEYTVSVEKKNNKFFIISNTVSRGYWHLGDDEIRLISVQKEINTELYDRIGELFQILLSDLKPATEPILTNKTEYYFSTTNNEGIVQTGQIFSPEYNSLLYKITKTCDNLASIGFGQNISQSKIQAEIEQLLLEMR